MYFGLVFAAGFVLGCIRVPLLVPRIGERAAELLEMPLMFAAVYLAAGHVVRRYGARAQGLNGLSVGAMALAMLVGAELVLTMLITGRGPAAYIASRDPVSGLVYLCMLAMFAVMPWLRVRFGR